MSKLLLFSLSIFLSFSAIQTNQDLTNAIKSSNGNGLSNFFDESIELKLPSSKGLYKKQQAKIVVDQFFKNNPVQSFEVKHEGGNEEKSFFQIGSLKSRNSSFRTYILYNLKDDKPQIIELRIENED